MEQHAVPQDITGFKFKLVGDMTIKQFGELAGGAVIAYIFYASGWHPIFKWPLVFFFGFMGFALAFLPIEERPLDIWIINFFKSIYQPTLYIWKKVAVVPTTASALNMTTTSLVMANLQPAPSQPATQLWPFSKQSPPTAAKTPAPQPDHPVQTPVVPAPAKPSAEPTPTTPAPQTLSIEDLQVLRDQKTKELEQAQNKLETVTNDVKADTYVASKPNIVTVDDLAHRRDEKRQSDEVALRELLDQNRKLVDQIESAKVRVLALQGADTNQLETQLDNLSKQHDDLDAKITQLRDQLEGKKADTNTGSDDSQTANSQVRISQTPTRQSDISLTDVPDIINGLIFNEQGVPLDSTILTIKDKVGNSIRALKSNQVGQFIASTPLEKGTYYLEFERPGYKFDVLEITLSGQLIRPIEVKGKPV